MKSLIARGSKPLEGCQVVAIFCQFALQSLVIVCPYLVMNQSRMQRKTVFGCFVRIGLYVSQIAFGRFARKISERAEFIVTMSAQVFWSRTCVAFKLLRSLSDVHAEKREHYQLPSGMGSNLKGMLCW